MSMREVLDVLVPGATNRVLEALRQGQSEVTPEQEEMVVEAFASAVLGVNMLQFLMDNPGIGIVVDDQGQIDLVAAGGGLWVPEVSSAPEGDEGEEGHALDDAYGSSSHTE